MSVKEAGLGGLVAGVTREDGYSDGEIETEFKAAKSENEEEDREDTKGVHSDCMYIRTIIIQ